MSRTYMKNQELGSIDVEGDWIIVHVRNRTITKLSGIGGYIWSLIAGHTSLESIINSVIEEYNITGSVEELDIACFLNELVTIGLVDVVRDKG
jgi:hypothetical protein